MIKIEHYPSVRILWGPEEYLIDKKIKGIIDGMTQQDGDAPEVIRLDSDETEAALLEEYLSEVSLFGQRRLIIMKRPKWLGEGKTRKGKGAKEIEPVLTAFIENPGAETHLLLTFDSAPSDNGVVALIKKNGAVDAVPALSQPEIITWIKQETEKHGSRIESNAASYLANSGQSMYALHNEIQRLALSFLGQIITADHVQDITVDAPETNVFKLSEALFKKRSSEALSILNIMLSKGQPVTLIIYMLTREFVMMGKVQSLRNQGMTSPEIAKRLNQKSFRVDKMLQAAQRHEDNLQRVISLLSQADLAVKSSQDDRVVMENLMIDLCQ